jgi:MoxR-like ATPase
VRAWALLEGRDHVVPEDVEALFARVVGHRVLFTARFTAATRNLSREDVLQRLWECCLELAPRPH